MAAVEVAASSLYINAVSHLIILMTIRTTMLLLSAFSDVIMSRAKWIGFPLPTLSLYYNTYFQFFCQTHAALSHPRTALSHPRTALSHPRTALSYPHTALSYPRTALSHPNIATSQHNCLEFPDPLYTYL